MGEPVWAIATLFPEQGHWSEADYLGFDTDGRAVEFADGHLEVLPVPTTRHQAIVGFLYVALTQYARASGGRASFSGIRLRLRPGKFRGPDVVFVTAAHRDACGEDYWDAADLVVEVVSPGPDDRVRDWVKKRAEYAEARIPEYWIVDPAGATITVLRLDGARYVEHGVFARGTIAASACLAGLAVEVAAVFDAE